MNSKIHYDNHANDIEYFNIHKHKIEVKRKPSIDLNDLSDIQLTEKLDDIEFRIEELTDLYNSTKHEGTHEALAKTCTFRSVIRKHIRLRKLETNQSLRDKIKELEQEKLNTNQMVEIHDVEEIEKLKRNNNSLKCEVNAWRKKYEEEVKKENIKLSDQVKDLQLKLRDNKETQKTKRHEINCKNEKYKLEYCKAYLKQVLKESEYKGIIEDLKEIQ